MPLQLSMRHLFIRPSSTSVCEFSWSACSWITTLIRRPKVGREKIHHCIMQSGLNPSSQFLIRCRLQRKDLVLLLLSKGGDITVCNNEGADGVATARSEAEYSPCEATHEILVLLEQCKEFVHFQ